jgi:hypothetical protein
MNRLEIALRRIETARGYTNKLLDNVKPDEWFRQPTEGVTHLAWQVGHLAVAQYGLALVRQRGVLPTDAEIITAEFRTHFGKGSTPQPHLAANPSPTAIRNVLDRVHQQVLAEAPAFAENVLDEPSLPAHPMFQTKFGALQ